MSMRRSRLVLLSVLGMLAVGFSTMVSVSAAAAVRRDASPTSFAAQAKALGITKNGPTYRFRKEQRGGEEGRLTVQLPTAWSDRADSHLVSNGKSYGVGVRATPNEEKFHTSFDVPGMKMTATTKFRKPFDASEEVANNAVGGCRAGSLRKFDNGIFEGMYQTFDRCGPKKAAAIVVAGLDPRGDVELFAVGLALTKADMKAIDKALATATLEKTSV